MYSNTISCFVLSNFQIRMLGECLLFSLITVDNINQRRVGHRFLLLRESRPVGFGEPCRRSP